jgi:TRAP-type C4-dicarboxylate transport system permease small subunit
MTTNPVPATRGKSRSEQAIKLMAAIEDGLLVFVLVALLGLAGTQIVLRNLFQTGLSWGDPLLKVMVLWIGLLGAMAATRDRNHISIDILSRVLPRRVKALSRLFTDLFTAAVCAVLAYHGARLMWMDWEAGTIAFGKVPAWLCQVIIPAGFGIIAARFLLFFTLHLRQVRPARILAALTRKG